MAVGDSRPGLSPVISAQQVRLVEDRQPIPLPHTGHLPEPTIQLFREGDAITGIEIVCKCGEKIRLQFDYGGSRPGF